MRVVKVCDVSFYCFKLGCCSLTFNSSHQKPKQLISALVICRELVEELHPLMKEALERRPEVGPENPDLGVSDQCT